MTDDLTIIRDALIEAQSAIKSDYETRSNPHPEQYCTDALAALERLEARVLPALPEGWVFVALQYHRLRQRWWCRIDSLAPATGHEGEGPTPRAAVLAAWAQITL